MHYDPRCVNAKHKCTKICISEQCNIVNPFICQTCSSHHPKQCEIIEYKELVRRLHKLQGINKSELFKYEEYVEQTFSTLMKSLQAEFINFREQFEHINVSSKIAQFYQTLKSHKQNKLNAKMVFYMLNENFPLKNKYKVKSQSTLWSLSSEIIELQKKVNLKLPYYYGLYEYNEENERIEQVNIDVPENDPMKEIQYKYRYFRNQLKGGLVQDHMNTVEKLLGKEIYNIQLIYKASKHLFSAKQFHKICDGKKNTLTIAKTEFGNLVGGFCAVAWRSPTSWQYEEDPSNQTFIFSLNKYFDGLRFQPFKTKFTVGMHRQYGPCFGDDLVIYDSSSTSKNCWSNFPDCYRCKQKSVEHNEKTIKEWVGVSDHFKKFNVVEWEVYKISFNPNQQIQRSFMQEYRKI